MSLQEKSLDFLFVTTRRQFRIPPTVSQSMSCFAICLLFIAAHSTAEGLLIRTVGTINTMAAWTLLRRIRGFHRMSCHATLGGCPGNVFRDVRKIGSIQITVHGAGLEAHRGHIQLFIDDPGVRVILDHLVDRPIDLLSDKATYALPSGAAGRGKLLGWHAFLSQTGPQLRFTPPLLPVPLVLPSHLAMKTAIFFVRRGCDEMHNAHIDPDLG